MAQYYELLGSCRWESEANCVECGSKSVVKNGKDDVEKCCQRYLCNACGHRFDDLSGTILSGSHHSLAQWISFLKEYIKQKSPQFSSQAFPPSCLSEKHLELITSASHA
jgi:transposase-like protein